MVEKEILMAADFDTPVDAFLDWWLWISLAQEHEFYYINEALSNWRLHKKSYIHTGKKPLFNPVQVQAYKKIYNKNKSIKFFFLIFFSSIKLFFVRGFRFLRRVCGKLVKK